ncbi:(6-4) photolyase [Pseudoalteromonas holothuriae]|uniref:(6-4) photolyase n=1 Tax=Pseudoalteromonas holothuriae TaxID=2963714 RepID=A0ABM9GLK8_9GAMM|nr:cryptochrome/photolyase family protein [Pseudoalteromonas sp. CIP111951]CAH9062200.1 (6-4) photolyase [Pseudoalteromonas sp. CIP111951]
MNNTYRCLRLILGDQLNAHHSWYKHKHDDVLYVIAELHQETSYTTHHIQKICAFFSAMEHFAQALTKAGHNVAYLSLDDTRAFKTIPELIKSLILKYKINIFEYQLPDEYRLRSQLSSFTNSLSIEVNYFETEHFYLDEAQLTESFKQGKSHKMEAFYRRMRKKFNILMDGEKPLGGDWNYDKQNRNKLKSADFAKVPEPLLFEHDVDNIIARLKRHDVKTIGRINDNLNWPVTRIQAKTLLDFFCQYCLAGFGQFQDAMTCKLDNALQSSQWSLFHSRLSFALNSKMLSPEFVISTVVAYYHKHQQQISLPQIEGFVRQILGWREFVRGIYWANMPQYAQLNHLKAEHALPSWFWNGSTHMNCLKHAIQQSLDYAYAHHIQRLMITGNFCLLAGIDPDEVDDWYLGVYIDAIEWVEMPNTRGMSQFADGGIVGSKAYAASGNYVKKMSDYCSGCQYDVTQATGKNACPLNSLYWRFMNKHEEAFATNPRNSMVYANWRRKSETQRQEIIEQAEQYLIDIELL